MKLEKLLGEYRRHKKEVHTGDCERTMNEVEFRLEVAIGALRSLQKERPTSAAQLGTYITLSEVIVDRTLRVIEGSD